MSDRETIAILTAGSVTLGLGHVQRMITLAKALAPKREIVFLTPSAENVRELIADAGFRVESIDDPKDALATVAGLAAVVIDWLDVDVELARWIRRETVARLVIFGNTSPANAHAHVVVNAILGTRFENRRFTDGNGTEFFEGPRYILLREEFRAKRGKAFPAVPIRRVLLLFGGSDQANLTVRALNALTSVTQPLEIAVCVGALYPHDSELEVAAGATSTVGHTVSISRNVADVCGLMLAADAVVTSPGGTMFEAMMLGVPAVAYCQNEFQSGMFAGFPNVHEQAAIDDLVGALWRLASGEKEERARLATFQVGEGFDDLVQAVQDGAVTAVTPSREAYSK